MSEMAMQKNLEETKFGAEAEIVSEWVAQVIDDLGNPFSILHGSIKVIRLSWVPVIQFRTDLFLFNTRY